ncbi:MAG: hypothetical protein ACI8XB_000746 [Patiriisocius sp.]|jgi:hypothetical protein
MKQLIAIILTILTILFANPSDAQCIKGAGDVITRKINVSSFDKLKIECSADVIVGEGNTQKVEVKGQSNIIDVLSTEVAGDTWKIDFDKSVCFSKEFVIYVTVPSLKAIHIHGSGDVDGETLFKEESFEVSINGSGDVNMNVEARDIEIEIDGSGDVNIEGSTNDLSIEIDGSGDVSAYNLETKNCSVEVNGSGDSNILVSGTLNVEVNGSGDVSYKGNPSNIQVDENGSGDVKHRE